MLPVENREVASTDLLKYVVYNERINELEAEQVETRLRPAESKLKGLRQTLASYQSTLQELHKVTEYRHFLTHKAEESFDILGKKHKQRKVAAEREREQNASQAEEAQKERCLKLETMIEKQKATLRELRNKTRELDAVRQAESDLVERLFRVNGIIMDPHHESLEVAVCSLAPRIFKMREAVAMYAVVHAKLESAAHQLKDAAEQLEAAFEPAHRIVMDKFGDQAGEVFFDPADAQEKRRAVHTADKLAKAAAQNLDRARLRMPVLPGLHSLDFSSLPTCLHPVLAKLSDSCSLETRRLVRDTINALYVVRHQVDFAVESVAGESVKVRRDLDQLEQSLTASKSQLDIHRRKLLSQLQQAKRSASMKWCEGDSLSDTVTGMKQELRERFSRRFSAGSALGCKIPSVNSGLSRLG